MDENQEKELKKEELTAQENKIEQKLEEQNKENELEQAEENPIQENKEITQEQETLEIIETSSEKKNKKPRKESYITGTIGAILGGAVVAIAWVVIYMFANHMVIPLLGTLIPVGALLGYKIFRGKLGKPLRVIITIISLLLIVLVTTVLCPSVLLVESGYAITLENLRGLYTEVRAEIRDIILENLTIGLIFTILGIVVTIIYGINRKIKSFVTEEEKQFKKEAKNDLKEKAEAVKEACKELNAMDSENAVTKKAILKQLKNANKLKRKKCKQYFMLCKLAKLLEKNKGKYYYDENDEENKFEQAPKINAKLKKRKLIKNLIKILIIALIITGIVVYYLFFVEKPYFVAGTNIELDISDIEYFYGTPEKIKKEVGEDASELYEFIIDGKEKKYELYGQVIPKTQYEEKDFGTIIQQERDYYAPYFGEDVTSQVEDKQFGEDLLKSYNYTTVGKDGNKYRAIIYLYEAENSYLWINVYTYYEIEVTQIDTVIDKLIK